MYRFYIKIGHKLQHVWPVFHLSLLLECIHVMVHLLKLLSFKPWPSPCASKATHFAMRDMKYAMHFFFLLIWNIMHRLYKHDNNYQPKVETKRQIVDLQLQWQKEASPCIEPVVLLVEVLLIEHGTFLYNDFRSANTLYQKRGNCCDVKIWGTAPIFYKKVPGHHQIYNFLKKETSYYLYSQPAPYHVHWVSCRHGNNSSTCSSSKT